MSRPLVEVAGLTKHFVRAGLLSRGPVVRAVEDVSLTIPRGNVLGVVGESGSGKTTVGRSLLRLIEPTAGRIVFDGTDITTLAGAALRPLRQRMQYVFQDPFASLSSRMTVAEILTEGLVIQRIGNRRERLDRAEAALRDVEMPVDSLQRYAHEFSGGQRQRIGIARALALRPDFIVADEPVSALDVSIQAQVVNLLCDLQAREGLTMLLISHDLAIVEFLCDHVVVLYLGRVMEAGPSDAIYARSRHPYTRALLDAAPRPGRKRGSARVTLAGDVPSPLAPPSGCVFRTRCPNAKPACAEAVPPLREVAQGHLTNCLYE